MTTARAEPAFEAPVSLAETHAVLDAAGPDAKVVAGGQSLTLLMRQGLVEPGTLVDIGGVPELAGIEVDGDRVSIGATTTYIDLGEHDVTASLGCLGDAVAVIADRQVRNLGTIGGAVAHADPSLDIVPPLLCLDAEVHLAGPDRHRTLPLADFLHDYMTTALREGELVARVAFDRPPEPGGSAYEKHAAVHGGWATVGAAAHVTLDDDAARFDDVRVAFAAVADTAVRAPTIENRLTGKPIDADAIQAAADHAPADIDPLGDYLGSASYREHLATVLARRAVETAVGRAGGAL